VADQGNVDEHLTTALSDRYRIESEIGSGGMATVYLAQDLKHDRKVAVKVLKPHVAAALGTERFPAEIRTTANLTHPHILPLHDSGEAGGSLYYAEGRESSEIAERGEKAAQETLELDERLEEAHAALGYILWGHDWDWEGADASFERALELQPDLPLVRLNLGLKEYEEAIRWLEKGYEQRTGAMVWCAHLEMFEPLREDPRFSSLMRRMGLPEVAPTPTAQYELRP